MARRTMTDKQLQALAAALAQAQQPPLAIGAASAADQARPTGRPGTELAVVDRGSTRPGQRSRRTDGSMTFRAGVRSLVHRNRRSLYPWLVAGVLFAVGYAAWLLSWLTGQPAVVAFVMGLVGLLAVLFAAHRLRDRIPTGWEPWAGSAAAVGIMWPAITAYGGPSYVGAVALVVATVLFGLRWWAHVRRPYPTSDPTLGQPDPEDDTPVDAARLIERWNTYLGCPNGTLPGSELTNVRPYRHGLRATIQLVPGKQALDSVLSALPRISTALDAYPEALVIEADRSGPPSQLAMQVVTRSPIRQTVWFDRPVVVRNGADWSILLGPYADGLGDAVFRLYSENSMESGYILGSKGSGKSRLTEIIAVTALAKTPTVIVYLDGQAGASSPLLWQHALWRGDAKDAKRMLEALLRQKDYRQLYNRYHRLVGFTPSPKLPGILVIVDECHRIFTPDLAELWATLAREGRKVGMGVLASSQVTTLDAFGGNDALRSSLVSSNAIALRTASRVQSQVFPGLGGVDLTTLPRIPGYGYTVDEGETGSRTAPFRARYLVGADQMTNHAVSDGVRSAEDWFTEAAGGQHLDDRTATAAGDVFLKRHEIAATADAELERMFNNAAAGVPEPVADRVAHDSADDASAGPATVIPFPRFLSWPPQPAPATAPDGLSPAEQNVYNAVTTGATSPAAVADQLGISAARVHTLLGRLLDAGYLQRTGRGAYQPTAPVR